MIRIERLSHRDCFIFKNVLMKKIIFLTFCSFLMVLSVVVEAQSQCATLAVNSTSPPILPCDTSKTVDIDFLANININFPVNATDVYTVNPIPYNPLPWVGTNSVLNNTDDQWSQVVPLPFSFCFFGNTYNSYVIGSNGRISFDTTLAGTFDAWQTSTPLITAPNATQNTMNNTIMAPYHDTDPGVSGVNTQITWDTFGVAPCRVMVINWTTLPMFSCNNLIDSQQIVLYELSNVIDINIANKPLCAGWNGGLALQGIQNSTGTVAYTVPGRNNTVWTANDDSYRFEPAGAPYVFATQYTWRDVTTGNILGNGPSLKLTPPYPMGVVVEAAITGGCNSDVSTARDTSLFIQGEVDAQFDVIEDSICLGEPIILSNTSTVNNSPFPAPNLLINTWDFGDGTILDDNNPVVSYSYTQGGVYTIQLSIVDTVLGCRDTIEKTVFVEATPYIEMTASPTTICLGDQVIFVDSSAPHTVSTTYDFDDGNVLLNEHNPKHTFERLGNYNVSFSGEYLICDDPEIIVPIQVNDYPQVNLGEDRTFCPGQDSIVRLLNIANPGQILTWSTGEQEPFITVNANETGRYWASAETQGCESVDSVWVKRDCYLNIPNSFTPNGDGRNDYFLPRQLLSSGLIGFSMKIMNRWGEVIFQTDKVDGRGWDGKLGGNQQSIGVYVYQIEATWKNGFSNSFTGNVTLVR